MYSSNVYCTTNMILVHIKGMTRESDFLNLTMHSTHFIYGYMTSHI